jgi:hypothetical protein
MYLDHIRFHDHSSNPFRSLHTSPFYLNVHLFKPEIFLIFHICGLQCILIPDEDSIKAKKCEISNTYLISSSKHRNARTHTFKHTLIYSNFFCVNTVYLILIICNHGKQIPYFPACNHS